MAKINKFSFSQGPTGGAYNAPPGPIISWEWRHLTLNPDLPPLNAFSISRHLAVLACLFPHFFFHNLSTECSTIVTNDYLTD